MNASPELTIGEEGKEAFDLVEPGRTGRRQMHMPARSAYEPIADQRRLVGCVIVDDQVHVEIGRDGGLDLVEEFAELDGAMARGELDAHPAGNEVVGWNTSTVAQED